MAMRVVVWLWVVWLAARQVLGGGDGPRRCQEITVPMCRGIGYNLTYMPNVFSHDTQEEAGLEVHQFWPLVEIQCSRDLRLFLCSMYAPICVPDYQKPLPACRSLCERVRRGCEPLMTQYGFAWPERMSCDGLPEYGDRHRLCMDFNSSAAAARSAPIEPPKTSTARPTRTDRRGGTGSGNCSCRCPPPLVHVTDPASRLFDVARTGDRRGCAVPCSGIYFGADDRSFVQMWIALWSAVCLCSTFVTVLTFAIDRRRFRYPERAIVFLSACYGLVAIGYIVRLAVGHDAVACEKLDAASSVIRYATTGPAACTTVFLLVYFFGMASCLWWVVLTFTWFLAAGLKWGQEAIAAHAHYFHLIAWMVPAVQTIAALAVSAVDGDPVSGICYVGNEDLANLRAFVLGPLCAYLLFGACFLIAGFVAMFRVRRVIRSRQQLQPYIGGTSAPTGADKLDRFMVRIGIVSVLYIVPASTVVACLVYEQTYRHSWERSFICSACRGSTVAEANASGGRSGGTRFPDGDATPRPDFSVFALKYFACLAVGITSGFWIWTRKTLDSWCRCGLRLCRCGGAEDKGAQAGAMLPESATALKVASSAPTSPFGVQVVGKRCHNPSLGLLQTPLTLGVEDCKSPALYNRV